MQPAEPIRNKPACTRDDALAVLTQLRAAGHEAYFAGGCVRDLLLGHNPKDYDIATNAPPKRVRQIFPNTQAVGAAFGVILVRHGRSVVEVATFRSDGSYLDGRRPSAVHFTTAQEDAQRRDFTINGLFLDPVENRVIDFVGGQADLAARLIRAIGQPDHRFEEDHLRLLRAVRFAARLGFQIEPETAQAIRRHAPLLKRISPERSAEELRLMLTVSTRPAAWRMLWDFGLIEVVFRFLPEKSAGPLDEGRSLFLAVAPEQMVIPFGLALAAGVLCYRLRANPVDIRSLLEKPAVHQAVRAMRQGLKISNEESDQMQEAMEGLVPLLADTSPTLAQRKRFLARPTASLSRQLLDAIAAVGQHGQRIAEIRQQLAALDGTDVAPPPLITGDDLVAAGLTPGPAFKRMLDAVYDAQLEGRIGSKDQAMAMARGGMETGAHGD